jgi:STAM-binding protein
MYLHDGNLPQAYLLYLRYSTLVLDWLKTHPEATTPEAKKALRSKYLTIDVVLKHMEELKPFLDKEYENWTAVQLSKKAKPEQHQQGSREGSARSAYKQHASKDPALSYASRLLDAGDHQDLAVELAQKEIQRRDARRRATKQDGEAHHGQQERRTAGYWENWTQDIAHQQAEDEETFRRQMESTRRTLDGDTDTPGLDPGRPTDQLPKQARSVSSYSYPKIARPAPVEYSPQLSKISEGWLPQPPQPPRPPKQEAPLHLPLAPERPAKAPHSQATPAYTHPTTEDLQALPSRPPKLQESHTEPTTKQQGVAFKPAAYLENGDPIRPIFLPRQLRQRFLDIASENTKRGLEMCGILCGTAVNNALFVRCLLIPEQKCTSDTCETENEGTMLEYCIEEDLLMLGWIHTHPTQTCFMSSRDLHTQSGYQVMLPESIAIVCAPKFEPS